jgi:4,5-DOPA dioxygenase extradiol
VLVLGSGSLTHDLRRLFGVKPPPAVDAAEIAECAGFRGWVAERSAAGDREGLLDYRHRAPFAAAMHPTEEHWLPFYIAAGAGGFDVHPQRLHEAVTYGCVAMDAYAFGPGAAVLAADLGDAAKQPTA